VQGDIYHLPYGIKEVYSMEKTAVRASFTYSQYIPVFLGEKRMLLSPVTLQNYERELRRGEKCLGSEEMSEITFVQRKR
jgi:hypothetical protein